MNSSQMTYNVLQKKLPTNFDENSMDLLAITFMDLYERNCTL